MTGRSRSIANEPQALSDFASGLEATCFVVCEATGGYEGALLAASVPVHRADARKVKAFIRSFGTIGKTDAIDARALARYGKDRCAELARWQARDAERLRLQVWFFVLIRRDMVRGRLAYANRRAAPCAEPAYAHLDALLESFDAQIKAVDADIAALTAQPIGRAAKALVAIEGMGAKTATARIALARPPPGRCPRGLAPHPKQAARPTPIAEPATAEPRSNGSSSWPPSPPANTTRPSKPSTNASSKSAKTPRRDHRNHAKTRRHRQRQT